MKQNSATRAGLLRATLGLAMIALAACAPTVHDSASGVGFPDSASGAGFSDYRSYERDRVQREAALRDGRSVPPPGFGVTAGLGTTASVAPGARVISDEDLRSAGLPTGTPALPGFGTVPAGTLPGAAPVQTGALGSNMFGDAAPRAGSTGISDEQDFDAVSNRESIESDAQRLARQRASYEVVQPTAVPTRPAGSAPNVVAFALSNTNAVGQAVYSRSRSRDNSTFLRACSAYGSSDRAQEDFLRNGGPQKDAMGIDPDGDGFACYWDPTPFRKVAGN